MGAIERLKKESRKKPKIGNKISIKKLSKRDKFFETLFKLINNLLNHIGLKLVKK